MAGLEDILSLLGGNRTASPLSMGQAPPSNLGLHELQNATPMRPEDLVVSPNPSMPHPPDQRMEGYRRMFTDFTYSLGSGLAAATANPRGRGLRTQAGMGAILQMPKILQDQLEAKKIAEDQRKLTTATALSGILNQQSEIQNRNRTYELTQQLRTIEQQRADQEAQNLKADNNRADAEAAAKAKGYSKVSTETTADGVFDVFAPNNWDGKDTSVIVKYKIGDVPDKEKTPKSLQNEEFTLKDGTHQVLSFDPTPTLKRPAGTYLNVKGQDVTEQVVGKYKAPAAPSSTEDSSSYKFHRSELDKRSKPIDDSAGRLGRLIDTLGQQTAQSDALIAPELLTVMAGGMGSGLRINEAEINRVQGGRPMIAQIQAKVRSWLSTDQKKAINFAPDERNAINQLIGIVSTKIQSKQDALTYAGEVIGREGTTDQQRKTALSELDKQLRAIDSGKVLAPDPTGKLHIFDDQAKADAFRKATGQ